MGTIVLELLFMIPFIALGIILYKLDIAEGFLFIMFLLIMFFTPIFWIFGFPLFNWVAVHLSHIVILISREGIIFAVILAVLLSVLFGLKHSENKRMGILLRFMSTCPLIIFFIFVIVLDQEVPEDVNSKSGAWLYFPFMFTFCPELILFKTTPNLEESKKSVIWFVKFIVLFIVLDVSAGILYFCFKDNFNLPI